MTLQEIIEYKNNIIILSNNITDLIINFDMVGGEAQEKALIKKEIDLTKLELMKILINYNKFLETI